MDSPRRYTIKAASRMCGVAPDTIRVWERRYSAVKPHREEKGRRLYDEAEVERLGLLKKCTELGHPIRLLAPRSDQELRGLLAAAAKSAEPPSGAADFVGGLIAAADDYDIGRFERELGRAAVALPPAALAREVLAPLLKAIGDRWADGRLTIAQEHALSASIRSLAGGLIRLRPRVNGRARILLATPAGERHEFGILLCWLIAASAGRECHYLGPDVPVEEILEATRRSRASVVAISVVAGEAVPPASDQLRRLRAELPPSVELWIGGAAAPDMPPDGPQGVVRRMDLKEFERRAGV